MDGSGEGSSDVGIRLGGVQQKVLPGIGGLGFRGLDV